MNDFSMITCSTLNQVSVIVSIPELSIIAIVVVTLATVIAALLRHSLLLNDLL